MERAQVSRFCGGGACFAAFVGIEIPGGVDCSKFGIADLSVKEGDVGGEGLGVWVVGRRNFVEGGVGGAGFGGGGEVVITEGAEKDGGGVGTGFVGVGIKAKKEALDVVGGVDSAGFNIFKERKEGVGRGERFGVEKAEAVVGGVWAVGFVGVLGAVSVGCVGEAEAFCKDFIVFWVGKNPGGDWAEFGVWWRRFV